jgi:IS1 family transposase
VPILAQEKKLQVLAALVEGNSARAIARMTGVHRDTIMRLGLAWGEGAQRIHNRMVRGLSCPLIQMDEMWSFVQKKQARVTAEDSPEIGEAYVFTALDSTSRMVISFHVGKRDQVNADLFMADLRSRLHVMPSIVSDGFVPYVQAVGQSFGPGVDFSTMTKNYRSGGSRPDHRYEPSRNAPFITKRAVFGAPDLSKTSTAYMERNNATMRHHIGRMRRLCYAFSKKLANHRAAIALTYCWYNLGMVVSTLRVSPALAAGVTDHIWDIQEFLAAIDDAAPCERPEKQPLQARTPETTSRPLPEGRGFLRLVPGTAANATAPAPEPVEPPPAPVAPVTLAVTEPAPVEQNGQLSLLDWRPRKGEQLSLW